MTIEKTVINEKWWVPEEVWLGEQAANDTLRARVAELEAMLPSALKAKLESAEARVAELEAKHPEWMKRIQRERLEERER